MTLRGPALRKTVLGYCDPLVVEAGDALRLHVSCSPPGPFRCDMVRLVCGDARPPETGSAGFQERVLDWPLAGSYPGREQSIARGSYVELPALPALTEFSFSCVVWPTRPGPAQCLAEFGDLRLLLDGGRPALQLDGDPVALPTPS